jgi:polyribonucleotide nucleotidyltransferase
MEKVEFPLGGKTMSIETGRLAKQAHGAVVVQYGGAAVLVTATSSKPREGIDFFPLTVDYVEKTFAAGKIPGGFFKREGRLSEKEILTSRFTDRALRPLFPEGYRDETQIHATVISADDEHDPDMLGMVGASAAICVSDIPFPGPIGAVRVARVDGELVANPSHEQNDAADLSIIVAARRGAIIMVEGGANQVPEAEILAALRFAQDAIEPMLDAQEELARRAGKPTRAVVPPETNTELQSRIEGMAIDRIREASRIVDKKKRYSAFDEIEKDVVATLITEYQSRPLELTTLAAVQEALGGEKALAKEAKGLVHDLRAAVMRERILSEQTRIDGRSLTDIRPITCEVAGLERVHGVGIFTRGETQVLATVTLGGGADEQIVDGLRARHKLNFMLHYNFPSFSVGETRPLRGPNRREIGHGALARRALAPVLPSSEESPYTIRIVSEVLESNGSSSMATVCSGTLALMDAGIQIKETVAGIAMGLIKEGDRYAVLSDILGDEDHLGDMDFKVAGTQNGITAIQMDIKTTGLDWSVMERALEQAREGRLHILKCMAEETATELPNFRSREELSPYAPRVGILWIKPDRIRDIIGPGGKVIRAIQEATGAKIDIEDTGRVMVFSPDVDALERCKSMIEDLTQEAEIGKLYLGKVKKVTDFGAFVEIFPGTDGLLHISELADRRVGRVEDICVEGDEVLVKCIDVDPSGKIRLSRRAALDEGERLAEKKQAPKGDAR